MPIYDPDEPRHYYDYCSMMISGSPIHAWHCSECHVPALNLDGHYASLHPDWVAPE